MACQPDMQRAIEFYRTILACIISHYATTTPLRVPACGVCLHHIHCTTYTAHTHTGKASQTNFSQELATELATALKKNALRRKKEILGSQLLARSCQT